MLADGYKHLLENVLAAQEEILHKEAHGCRNLSAIVQYLCRKTGVRPFDLKDFLLGASSQGF